jgi:hypothetical protein
MIKIPLPCGAGKSHGIQKNANEWVTKDGAQVIIAVPSIPLANQYHNNLKERFPLLLVEMIHGEMDSVEYPVREILARLMQKVEPMVLIITQRAFEILCEIGYYSRRGRILVLDEIPMPFKMERYFDVKGIAKLLPLIQAVQTDDLYYTIVVKPECLRQLKKIADWRTEDKILTRLQEIAYQLLSTNWVNMVNKKAWDTRHTKEFDLMCLITGDILKDFKQVYVAGACFDDSAWSKWYSLRGTTFEVDEAIMADMRYREHFNGPELTVYYAIPRGYNWSKDFMQGNGKKKAMDEYGNYKHEAYNLQLIEKDVLELFDKPFIFNSNIPKERNGNYQVFDGIDRAVQLPQTIHGINDWMEYTDVACFSARNLPVDYINFLKKFIELDIYEIRNCIGRQFCYQSALRGALRDPYNNHEPKRVYIPDEETAEWFASMFEGCKVIHRQIEGLELPQKRGKPRRYRSEIERNAARREKREKQIIGGLDTTFVDEVTADRNRFHGSLFGHTKDKVGLGRMSYDTHDIFEEQLLKWHETIDHPKEQNILISPAYFAEVEDVETGRGRINVLYCNGIMLDVDGIKVRDASGEVIGSKPPISPEAFAKLFPRLRMTISNSYNSTLEHPKYHMYIPTDRWMTGTEYENVVSNITVIAGNIGFDMSKIFAHSMFYIPSQAKDPLFGNYFKTFNDGKRKVLYVDDWLSPKWDDEPEVRVYDGPKVRDDQKVARAIEMYSPAIAPPKESNVFAFILGCRLKDAGCEPYEAGRIMLDEISKCRDRHSQTDLRAQTKAIMKKWPSLNTR